jgi:hypothetical protein
VAIVMKEHSEEWKQLCAQAAIEQDPQKLLELTRKINELLLGKQSRLNRESSSTAEPHRDWASPKLMSALYFPFFKLLIKRVSRSAVTV